MDITDALLTLNKWSRSQRDIHPVKSLVLHWVANAGTTAMQNRDYWDSRKYGNKGYGAAHYVIDDSTILRCIPEEEVAYHVGARQYTDYSLRKLGPDPNYCTLGIEMTHADWTGEPSEDVWRSAIELAADICVRHGLDPYRDITTHHCINPKKECHKWLTDHVEDLQLFQLEVEEAMR